MNVTITGNKDLKVTPALHGYVMDKLCDRIKGHFDEVVNINVILTVDSNLKEKELTQQAECTVHVKGRDLFAQSTGSNLYAAVDELGDKMNRQVLRYKDKLKDHHHIPLKRQED